MTRGRRVLAADVALLRAAGDDVITKWGLFEQKGRAASHRVTCSTEVPVYPFLLSSPMFSFEKRAHRHLLPRKRVLKC